MTTLEITIGFLIWMALMWMVIRLVGMNDRKAPKKRHMVPQAIRVPWHVKILRTLTEKKPSME